MTQNEALDILKTGANVFLTGEPGSGKTHTVNGYVSYLREHDVEPAITASTGIAATHIGGMTVHAWSGIGIKKFLTDYDLDRIASSEGVVRRIRKTGTLIIDEVSMLSPNLLTMVDQVCREVKGKHEPFGGMQVVLVGDFFQLPPIVQWNEHSQPEDELFESENAIFAYQAPVWKNSQFIVAYLTEQHRQEDATFLDLLSAIRRNEFDEAHLELLTDRLIEHTSDYLDIPQLYSRNEDVDRINEERLGKIEGSGTTYTMQSQGNAGLVAGLKKGCLSPEELILKKGAKVMFTKNNRELGFVNGTLGEVVEAPVSGYPRVMLRSGQIISVEPMDWIIEENGAVRARINQMPLRLAWAITIHKSQGMSLDAAVMDLRQVFEYGQGYVALSRVRSLAGIHLHGWNQKVFQVHPEVLDKDTSFRAASLEAGSAFGKIEKESLEKMHQNFIRASGGKKRDVKKSKSKNKEVVGEKKSNYFDKIREKHPNAYRPWKPEDDVKLKRMFGEDESGSTLTKEFGRQPGSIRARLIKLGLVEE